ncbi:MAG: DUF2892 domain-containing protein [Mariprofundaceae bacterium]|nr:DUF2892 domain-containing protein [Mariprofundaceae bacterium]
MKGNLGGIDRIVRLLAGVALIAGGFLAGIEAPWNDVAMGAGVVFILTSMIKFCPLYKILGINSCPRS